MSLRALRTLQAISRHGSFARAAETVGLTQSAVSLQIKSLEAEFDVSLFDRSRRLPILTEAGRIVLTRAEEILALYDAIPAALGIEQAITGRLRLGAIQTALFGIVPDALAALTQDHPQARIHLVAGVSATMSLQIASGDLDAAITTEPIGAHPPDLVWTPLYEDHLWLIGPAGTQTKTARELVTKYPFIRFDPRAWAGRIVDKELRRMRLNVREEMVLDSPDIIVRMVERGLGVAVVPLTLRQAQNLPITCLPFGTPQVRRTVVLMEHRSRPSSRLTEALALAIRREGANKLLGTSKSQR
ncbi:LysR family transcriptional regulator [Haematobacter genomosp. 1]|uniref:LysR family transcriptional regulator n=2 Tax=Haematobacter genomosp. 1 TaxID=366618 RepID=A0A212AAS7_9RHOB|nr:LysR family transcriptional regulator [Haematobacter genomosp. 1]